MWTQLLHMAKSAREEGAGAGRTSQERNAAGIRSAAPG